MQTPSLSILKHEIHFWEKNFKVHIHILFISFFYENPSHLSRIWDLKRIKSLIQQFEYLSESFLPVVSIEPLSKSIAPLKFQATYVQPHVKEQTAHLTTHHFTFDGKKEEPSIEKISTFPLTETGIRANSLSSSGLYRAVIRKKGEATVLEIWGTNHLLQSLKISDFHSDLYTDAQFTSKALIWSQDEKKLLYIAEKKEEKTPNYFASNNPSDTDYDKYLKKFLYEADLGEGYDKKFSPIVCIYDLTFQGGRDVGNGKVSLDF